MRRLFIILSPLLLQGCYLDKISSPDKPTPAQQAMVDAGMFGSSVQAVMTELLVEPECQSDVFRVSRCVGGVVRPWSYT